MENFKNKTVIVTGSTQGIGLEIAKLFISNGSNVIINSRNDNDKLNEAVGLISLKKKNIRGVLADVSTIKGARGSQI